MYIHTYICVYICTCIYVYAYIYARLYINIHTYICIVRKDKRKGQNKMAKTRNTIMVKSEDFQCRYFKTFFLCQISFLTFILDA